MSNRTAPADDAAPADDVARTDDPARADEPGRSDDHLDGIPDGAGCTEIWERLSDARADD